MKTAAALLAAVLAAACRSPSGFPIGIYDPSTPEHLEIIAAAGFNWACVGSPEEPEEYLRQARRLGLSIIASPSGPMREAARKTGIIPVWYLRDEPDVHKVPPEDLAASIEALRREWPDSRTTFALGSGGAVARYSNLGDFLMVDWYPVPHLPLDSVAEQLDQAKRDAGAKPVWMILQAFDWRKDDQRDSKRPRLGRFPDHREIRFMSYLSLVHGADGLFYYTFHDFESPNLTLAGAPERWQALRRVVEELAALRPYLNQGPPRRLEGLQAPLENGVWRNGRKELLVLVNRSNKRTLLPARFHGYGWRPLFEPRRRPEENLERGPNGEVWMGPWQVLALEGRAS